MIGETSAASVTLTAVDLASDPGIRVQPACDFLVPSVDGLRRLRQARMYIDFVTAVTDTPRVED